VKLIDRHATEPSALSVRLIAAFAAILVLGLLLAAPALAGFEQVGTFGESGEETRFELRFDNTSGIAVNTTGAGGVPAGTVYAVSHQPGRSFVARYSPKGQFREAWGWNEAGLKFERCGPDGEPAHPTCTGAGAEGNGLSQLYRPIGVAVDQTTGDVYVLNGGPPDLRPHDIVQVFSPDGSQLIASFGDAGRLGESFDEGPANIHQIETLTNAIAVDASGNVFISDFAVFTSRVMVFSPQTPGDYTHYVYPATIRTMCIPAGRTITRMWCTALPSTMPEISIRRRVRLSASSLPATTLCQSANTRYRTPAFLG
jgi:hypothetical protein